MIFVDLINSEIKQKYMLLKICKANGSKSKIPLQRAHDLCILFSNSIIYRFLL